MKKTTEPSFEQLSSAKELPQDVSFDMVNILKFKQSATYEHSSDDQEHFSGQQAYGEYAKVILPLINKIGGKIIYAGRSDLHFVGDKEQDYDNLVIVRYPSRGAYLSMVNSDAYQAVIKHRIAGLEFRVLNQLTPLL